MNSFFILQNTQSGKLSLTAKEIKKWNNVVVFFISSNDRTLVDQSAEGLTYFLDRKVFVLSSNHNENLEYIKGCLSDFPIVATLANKQQNTRVLELIYLCQRRSIKYAIIFDEADTTYPILRDQSCLIGSKLMNYHSAFKHSCLHRVGFVSATEGCLCSDEYPECARSELLCVQPDTTYYRAIHTREAILHEAEQSDDTNNEYALSVLRRHRAYFFKKSVYGYRKIILNSNSQTSDMEAIAQECVQMGMNAIVFNMNGLSVLCANKEVIEISVRGKRFNQMLFNTVERYELDDRPLVIIGRRKVDRGLSFHYAPRDGSPGLIWTDIILGDISDVSIAVQKAGRMAGIIAHCPQYSGECHYWAPSSTLDKVLNKNRLNDQANRFSGKSLVEALRLAACETERFVERVSLSEDEMLAYYSGQKHSLSERLEYYTIVESDENGERPHGNLYRVNGNTFCFYQDLQLDPRANVPLVSQLSPTELESVMGLVIQRKLVMKELLVQKFPSISFDDYTFLDCRVVDSIDFIKESAIAGRKIGYPNESDSFQVLIHPESGYVAVLIWDASRIIPIKRCSYIKRRGKYAGLCCGRMCKEEFCSEHIENKLPEGVETFIRDEEIVKYISIIDEEGDEEIVKYISIIDEEGDEEIVLTR